ncbi:MAG: hypothetical protein NT034_04465 [Candidatus Magasanikbacteria bacterium]|nr:hypothetical protein [Candidatus Magasanikbacteria bacterium]
MLISVVEVIMPQEVPHWAQGFVVGEGILDVCGVLYPYHILGKNLTQLRYFLGFPKAEFLFVSEEVPAPFRDHVQRHEVNEFVCRAGQPGRCLASLKQELAEVPEAMLSDYIVFRREQYHGLVAYYADDQGLDDLKQEIAASLAYLETL